MAQRWFFLPAILFLGVLTLFACSSGDQTYAILEPDGVPQEPTMDQVMRIMERHCAPCHADGSDSEDEAEEDESDDDDALEHLDLKTCQGVWENRGEVFRVVLDKTMPPGAWPRLDDRDVLLIQRWLFTETECPCEEACP